MPHLSRIDVGKLAFRAGRATRPPLRTALGGRVTSPLTSRVARRTARARVTATVARERARAIRRTRLPRESGRTPHLLAGAAVGALSGYLLDPASGRRRRKITAERTTAAVRRLVRAGARKARYASGVAKGAAIETARSADVAEPQIDEFDDTTLARKVETEIFRPAHAPKDNVNVEHGVVYLRGALDDAGQVESLVTAARKVAGVKAVKNLLHTPDEPATGRPESTPGRKDRAG